MGAAGGQGDSFAQFEFFLAFFERMMVCRCSASRRLSEIFWAIDRGCRQNAGRTALKE